MTVIIGGSGSGKSAYAEQLAVKEHTVVGGSLFYIATMRIYDAEGEKKVQRHKRQRADKGFATIEQHTTGEGQESVETEIETGGVALLECMSNLVANEMFLEDGTIVPAEYIADRVVVWIERLSEALDTLIVVTNNVFEDGIHYDVSTMEYVKALGGVNCRLAELADTVVEVIAGIPVVRKGDPQAAGSAAVRQREH